MKWIKDYITNQGGLAPDLAPLGLRSSDILYYSYRSPAVPPAACASSTNPGYEKAASCWSLDDIFGNDGEAAYLDGFVKDLVIADPQVEIYFIGHSQGGVLATYYAAHYAASAIRARIRSVITVDSPLAGVDLTHALVGDAWNHLSASSDPELLAVLQPAVHFRPRTRL